MAECRSVPLLRARLVPCVLRSTATAAVGDGRSFAVQGSAGIAPRLARAAQDSSVECALANAERADDQLGQRGAAAAAALEEDFTDFSADKAAAAAAASPTQNSESSVLRTAEQQMEEAGGEWVQVDGRLPALADVLVLVGKREITSRAATRHFPPTALDNPSRSAIASAAAEVKDLPDGLIGLGVRRQHMPMSSEQQIEGPGFLEGSKRVAHECVLSKGQCSDTKSSRAAAATASALAPSTFGSSPSESLREAYPMIVDLRGARAAQK